VERGQRAGITPVAGPSQFTRGVAFSPDSKRLAIAGSEGTGGTAEVWDAVRGQQLLTLRGHSGPVAGVAFSPDGKHLATASWDGTVQIYALDIQELLALARSRITRKPPRLTLEECKRYFRAKTCRPQ